MRTPVLALLATLATAAGLLVAASSPPAAQAADTTAKPLKIILVGDSYSAGNGARDANGDRDYYGPSGCYRSRSNWAEQYVAGLGAKGYNVTFVNRACSGATTADLLNKNNLGDTTGFTSAPSTIDTESEAAAYLTATNPCASQIVYPDEESLTYKVGAYGPDPNYGEYGIHYACTRWLIPQLDAVNGDADIVLFTMGGNDIGFSDIIQECFAIGVRDAHDCRDKVESARKSLPDAMEGVREGLAAMRAHGLRDDARVVMLGYPKLALDNGYDLDNWFGFGEHYEVADEVRALGEDGNEAQATLIAEDNQTHPGQVTHLGGIAELFEGHEPDGQVDNRNEDRWIHEFDTKVKMEWYHPNPIGQEEYAGLLGQGDIYGAAGGTASSSGDIDIVFAIDTTGSMSSSISAVRNYVSTLVDDVAARTSSARYALVSYGDNPAYTGNSLDYTARVDHGFTTDVTTLKTALGTLSAYGGGDWPEAMYSGIEAGIGLPWRPGVKKVIIVLADAPPHEPEPITGLTATQVTRDAIAVDPAEVYLVDTGQATSAPLQQVVSETGGQIIDANSSSDVPGALATVLDVALTKPYAWLNGPYVAKTGKQLTVDGSGSYATTGSITRYDWDFDSDGTIDQTSTDPVITHTWATPYTGLLTLTVTDSEGRTSVANTHVGITDDGDETPRAVDNCPDVDNQGQEDYDSDGIGDECDSTPGWPTLDKDGVVEGTDQAAWPFTGFVAPVDNPMTVNSINAGQAVPFKFSLGGDRGPDILASGSPTTQRVSCNSLSGTVDPIENPLPATSTPGLAYDGTTSYYTYVWKTPKAAAGTCQQFKLKLADGSEHLALFRLK